MTNCVLGQWNLPELELRSLIRRCELVPALLRRQIEEEITALVEPNLQPSDELWASFRQKHHLQDNSADLESWLQKRWSERICAYIYCSPSPSSFSRAALWSW